MFCFPAPTNVLAIRNVRQSFAIGGLWTSAMLAVVFSLPDGDRPLKDELAYVWLYGIIACVVGGFIWYCCAQSHYRNKVRNKVGSNEEDGH